MATIHHMYDLSTTAGVESLIANKCYKVRISPLAIKYVRNLLAAVGHMIGNPERMTYKEVIDRCSITFGPDIEAVVLDGIRKLLEEHPVRPDNMQYMVHNRILQEVALLLISVAEEYIAEDEIVCSTIDTCIYQDRRSDLLSLFRKVIPPQSLVLGSPIAHPTIKAYTNAGCNTVEGHDTGDNFREWAKSDKFTYDDECAETLSNGAHHIVYLMLQGEPPRMAAWLQSIPIESKAAGTNLVAQSYSKIFNLVVREIHEIAKRGAHITYNMIVHAFLKNRVFDLAPYLKAHKIADLP